MALNKVSSGRSLRVSDSRIKLPKLKTKKRKYDSVIFDKDTKQIKVVKRSKVRGSKKQLTPINFTENPNQVA